MESSSIIVSAVKDIVSKSHNVSRVHKVISISAAVAATFTFVLFKRTTTPPKRLRHIPHVGYVKMMMAFLAGKPMMDISKTCIDPVIASSTLGLYLRPSRKVWNIYVTEPELAKIVYNKNDLFPKLDLTRHNAGTYNGKFSARSNNLFFSVGDEWKRQRRIANPAFHRAMPISLFGLYAEKLFASISKSHSTDGNVVDLGGYVTNFTLDIIGDAGFDFKFSSLQDSTSEYVTRYEKVVEALMDPLFYFFPALDTDYLWLFPKRQEIHKELGVFLDMVQEIIVKKRQTLAEQKRLKELAVSNGETVGDVEKRASDKDILTLLIESADEEENKDISDISDDMLLSNMCVLFTAGHDTTTAALLFCIYELAVNQDIQEKARNEIVSILGDEESDVIPTAEQLVKMEYLNMIIKETLRLHSPVAVSSPRLAMEDCMLGSTLVPKGSTVVIDAISIHRNAKYWKHPDEFNPDRFAAGGEAEKHAGSGLTYVPFGGGTRHCIGRNFAMNEQKVMLSMFLRKYTWTLSKDSIHQNGLVTKGIFLLNTPEMKVALTSRY
ncbi:unnamed protein product [Mucor fragilis]